MKQYLTRACGALLCLFFFSGSLHADEFKTEADTRQACETFMNAISANDIEGAFASIRSSFPIPEEEFMNMQTQTIEQMGIAVPRFGGVIDVKLVTTQKVGDFLIRYTYALTFERHILRYVFTFYRPKDSWIMNSFVWDDSVDAFFKDS